MPIVITIGVLGVVALGIFLFGGSASAGAATGGGTRKGGTKPELEEKKIIVKIPDVEPVPIDDIAPIPTPGRYYRIMIGDIGSAICVKAYGGERPTARWLHVAAHPMNKVRLGSTWPNWFLPRWHSAPSPAFSVWAGTHTGEYAVIWLPLASEVPV